MHTSNQLIGFLKFRTTLLWFSASHISDASVGIDAGGAAFSAQILRNAVERVVRFQGCNRRRV
jgi:hypothetical protein